VLLLWVEAVANGYAAPIWMTYKQASALRAHVQKGEHGTMVVYAERFTKTEVNNDGEQVEAEIPFLKAYTVFNVEQIEGFPQHYYAQPDRPLALLSDRSHLYKSLILTGGGGRNRTGVHGFAGRCITTLPPRQGG
jgi:antirestriction protein ArdC